MAGFLSLLAAVALAAMPAHGVRLGTSEQGRPIVAIERGDPFGRRLLVVGCIHGTECAGIRVVRLLEYWPPPPGIDLWLVPDLNPDGRALGTRQDARGVDLNRNFPAGWRSWGRPGDVQYPGPRPFSERETRIVRSLVERIRPDVTVWYHQHMDTVWAHGPSLAAGRRYARASGMRLLDRRWLGGTAPHWQNVALGQVSFVVELPAGELSEAGRQAAGALAAVMR